MVGSGERAGQGDAKAEVAAPAPGPAPAGARHRPVLVGFAAETENALENARRKLTSKSLDAIVVNDVSRKGIGMDSERNAVTIITPTETIEVPETTKWEVAHRVLDAVVRIKQQRSEAAPAGTRR